jgi:predicted membrane-bound dolichyl-phosphate-mannose-protein mannosyltransferase
MTPLLFLLAVALTILNYALIAGMLICFAAFWWLPAYPIFAGLGLAYWVNSRAIHALTAQVSH